MGLACTFTGDSSAQKPGCWSFQMSKEVEMDANRILIVSWNLEQALKLELQQRQRLTLAKCSLSRLLSSSNYLLRTIPASMPVS